MQKFLGRNERKEWQYVITHEDVFVQIAVVDDRGFIKAIAKLNPNSNEGYVSEIFNVDLAAYEYHYIIEDIERMWNNG